MVHIRARNYLICSMGIESRENDTETLIFLKNSRKERKKNYQDLNPGPLAQKSSALSTELSKQLQDLSENSSFINYYEENKGQKAKNFAKGLIHPDIASK